MKFDMHCHTREGSIDARVGIEAYARKLIDRGFDGMMVTDHNSYSGYRAWESSPLRNETDGIFTVLKGIEYDTRDGGHVLAVLPDGVHCRLLELRGMSIAGLERIVHSLGGILGPAHPYGTGFFALMHNQWVKRHREIIEKFDFIEIFNSCVLPEANHRARELADRHRKPGLAGSDAHREHVIGTAATVFDRIIRCNNDLIRAIRDRTCVSADNSQNAPDKKKQNAVFRGLGVVGYWVYNKAGALLYGPARTRERRETGDLEI